uniref:Cyclic nucleotide-gated cation channel beta-1-like n=1 Tax=Phallusia mammillata TaxID=59560 RepID=A0A6F9D8X4_9ASCI|nr:cyclic nucleotide-gated cation channel beta-1-like [Phallusia mammillata]
MDEQSSFMDDVDIDAVKKKCQSPAVIHAYQKWHKKCHVRAKRMEKHLFEDDSSSGESGGEEEGENHGNKDSMFQNQEVTHRNFLSVIINYKFPDTINPDTDTVYLIWQFLVTLCFMYNASCVPLRMTFPYQTKDSLLNWLTMDYVADSMYLIDMLVFQVRRQYLLGGVIQTDQKLTLKYYLSTWRFRRDVISLLPTDLLYLKFGVNAVFRVNRLFKLDSYYEFNDRFEMILKQAYVFRVFRTTGYLLYVIHLDACLYYYISYVGDFKSPWGYNLEGNAYVRCYFWAFMTTITIGNVPEPDTTVEYMIQLVNYFGGLFIFSVVIGQVRDSVHAATAAEELYRSQKNSCINYMQKNHIPVDIQRKVRLWFEYTWNTQRILDENALLKQMPDKMHTDLAINVHMDVLSKVEIFKECDRQLLYDLLLKLKPVLYLPGDYVCKKGEVGREMYIITNGMVQVVGDSKSTIFASLYPGTAFGEISLLAIGGGNRRTANIYSPGYTTLFLLLKNDLNEVVKNYPAAQKILRKKAMKMLNKDNKQPIIITRSSASRYHSMQRSNLQTGGFLNTMLQVAKMRNKDLNFVKDMVLKVKKS